MMKTSKTIAKRFRVTRKNKVERRRSGQGHFNARESGNTTRKKRRDGLVTIKSYAKTIRYAV